MSDSHEIRDAVAEEFRAEQLRKALGLPSKKKSKAPATNQLIEQLKKELAELTHEELREKVKSGN